VTRSWKATPGSGVVIGVGKAVSVAAGVFGVKGVSGAVGTGWVGLSCESVIGTSVWRSERVLKTVVS
jgi:hypothetical protein